MDENSSREFKNTSSSLPPNVSVTSEENKTASESFGNSSESKANLSEKEIQVSEGKEEIFRKLTKASEKTVDHSLTVRETAKIFEDSGVPRTERSIINWCNQNSQGECRLDCYYDNSEHKYYITPQSINKVIHEEKSKSRNDFEFLNNLSESRQDFSEAFGNEVDSIPKLSESHGKSSETISIASETLPKDERTESERQQGRLEYEEKNKIISDMEAELNKMREEKIRAESSTGYKDELLTFFKNQISNDRDDYNNRMKFMQDQIIKLQEQSTKYADQVIDSQRRIGSLESHLRQLEAPKSEQKKERKEAEEAEYRDPNRVNHAPQTESFNEPKKPEEPEAQQTNYQPKVEEPLENQNNYQQNHERVSIHPSSSGEQNHFSPEDSYPRQ